MQLQNERGSDYLVKLRTLTKSVPPAQFIGESPATIEFLGTSGWRVITHSTSSGLVVGAWEGYIDLSGYTREEQTWFTRNVMIQGMAQPAMSSATATRMFVHEIVSEIRLTDDQLAVLGESLDFPGGLGHGHGMPGHDVDLQSIVFGRVREFAPLTTLPASSGACQILSENFYGTNSGSAASKLWCYVVISNIAPATFGTLFFIQGAIAFVLSGAVDEEPDLEYIMRLKRSYELGDTFS